MAYVRQLLQRDRGEARARLDADTASQLWCAILDGSIDDLELGAIVAALAVRGESLEELAGLHHALQERLPRWNPPLVSAPVSIPAYGLFPGEALVTALTACLLRRFEVPVVVHGILDSPCGISAACVLRELGVMPCATHAQANESLQRTGIAFLPAGLLSPTFASLIGLRYRLGVANCAHRVAQAIEPLETGSVRLMFGIEGAMESCQSLAMALGGDYLLLGWPKAREPSILAQRPRIERISAGHREVLFTADPEANPAKVGPATDAGSTARWIEQVVNAGEAIPVPVANVVAGCLYASRRASSLSEAKAVTALQSGPRWARTG